MADEQVSAVSLESGLIAVRFTAMACPCEVLLADTNLETAVRLGRLAADEVWRIERKYSRYRADSLLAEILRQRGTRIAVDSETGLLLDFAKMCYDMSNGLFDITSGVLRHAWVFDRSERIPDPLRIAALLPLIGFDKVEWQRPFLRLPVDMELDFGGIGKEYAVDRAYVQMSAACDEPFLVNFGGDLRASRPPSRGAWHIGIERPQAENAAALILDLERGALATSGDTRRYLVSQGNRYGHILNPLTGWPVAQAPSSVTVAAPTCTEAGLLSTLAMLQGAGAQAFLEQQGVKYWILHQPTAESEPRMPVPD